MESDLRLVSPEQVADHNAAVAAIELNPETIDTLVVLVTPKHKKVLAILMQVTNYVPGRRLSKPSIRKYNDCLAKVHNWPKMLTSCGLALSAYEQVLVEHVSNLLFLAADGKRFLAPKAPREPGEPRPHVVIGDGLEREPMLDEDGIPVTDAAGCPVAKYTRCLRYSRDRRLAEGHEGIRVIIGSALHAEQDRFKPILRRGAPESVGSWCGYELELAFMDTVSGKLFRMLSIDKRIQKALTVKHPMTKKKVLDPLGTEVNNLIIAKIKDLLRERDIRDAAVGAMSHDAMVYCCEPTCEHSSGYLVIRGHLPYASCSNGHHTCLQCMCPRHVGDCDAAAAMDAETRELLVTSSKPCPGCHTLITKNDGCNHMTCRCGQHFCWRCLTPFTPQMQWIAHNSADGTCNVGMNVYARD